MVILEMNGLFFLLFFDFPLVAFLNSQLFYGIIEPYLFRGMNMKETVYFGTYTRRTSQGIYKADFDTETGQLSHLKIFANEPSPT